MIAAHLQDSITTERVKQRSHMMRLHPFFLSLASLVFLAAAGATRATDDGPIEIGVVYNLAGSQAGLDVPSSNGALMAFGKINDDGGVLGREFMQIQASGDSQLSVLRSVMESALIASPSIAAFIGLSDTDNVRTAATIAKRSNLVFLTSGATSPQLPAEFPGTVFLACFGDNVQAAAGAEWAYQTLGARKVHVYADMDLTYPRLLQGYFVDSFKALGGTVEGMEAVKPGASQLVLTAPGDVDLVYVSVETAEDANRVISALRDAGYTGPVLGGDGYDEPETWKTASNLGDIYFTTHVYLGDDHSDDRVAAFVSDYRATFGGEEPTAFAALAYDAVGLMAAAIANAGSAAPDKIAGGLAQIDGYEGVTGEISYAGGSQIPVKSVTLVKIDNGAFSFVDTVTPKQVPKP